MNAVVATLLLAYLSYVDAIVGYDLPEQGFHLITSIPEAGRRENNVYVYAIRTPSVENGAKIEFSKEGGLPSSIVQTGKIEVEGTVFGCYLEPNPPRRMAGVRYGEYTATYTPVGGSATTAYTFVKTPSKILDTRGVYTVTIYPESVSANTLSRDSPRAIGVRWFPGCRKITWCKGIKRNVNTGERLDLDSIDDAGLYTITRPGRGSRGWFAQIKVIAAKCPEHQFWNTGSGACENRITSMSCLNGGVGRDESDECICPPSFVGSNCNEVCQFIPQSVGEAWPGHWSALDLPNEERDRCRCGICCKTVRECNDYSSEKGDDDAKFALAVASDFATYVRCKDLEGGNEKCKGFLFCLGDLYGCTCGLGWMGNNCNRPCPKGQWGANCSQRCDPDNSACDRFFGGL